MWRYLLSLGTICVLAVLLGAGLLLNQSAGAQPTSAEPAAPRLVPPVSPTPPECTPGWTIYPNPAPPGDSALYGLTARAPNDLWAVGYYGSVMSHTLTVHGDGTNWTQVPSPDPGSGNVVLSGVAGARFNDVWAVGSYQTSRWQTLIEHWNGT